MKIEIAWRGTSLATGDQDPHKGTPEEGKYAHIKITHKGMEYDLKMPSHQYDKQSLQLMKYLVLAVNYFQAH